ncbi:MAG: RND family transporter [Gemmatimonadota bacterium]
MSLRDRIVEFSIRRPKTVVLTTAVLFVSVASLIPGISIDTDPENMLPADQGARVFHDRLKEEFSLYDIIVVGVVNDEDADGVFNPSSLARILELTRAIEGIDGVIRQDLLSLATVDNISQGEPGVLRFTWMMREPPETRAAAIEIRDAARRIPMIEGTLMSEDGRAAAIYVPIVAKGESHRIAGEIEDVIAGFEGDEQYFITGLPVAEDTFGVEMFKQMGIAAPLAGLIIFLMLWFFFRSVALILAPMIVAIVTVVVTMGLLIGLGFTVHIMSSMIPIFLMPIAVVDSVHILSEFADVYPQIGDRRATMRAVLRDLFTPMLFTSLTSAIGFASLALAPIPPVRVFGGFVAFGIVLAFVLTITFIPAYVVLLKDSRIARLARDRSAAGEEGRLALLLARFGPGTVRASKAIIAVTIGAVVIGAFGITQIQINDNPVRWFRETHPIRVADRVLNEHFGGTYDAFLAFSSEPAADPLAELDGRVGALLEEAAATGPPDLRSEWDEAVESTGGEAAGAQVDALVEAVYVKLDDAAAAEDDAVIDLWDQILVLLEGSQAGGQVFKTPEALGYIESLQADLQRSGLVGKSNSLSDIVKTVYRELRGGDAEFFAIPSSSGGVAQTLLSYQSSHRPQDLWHFVTPDFGSANVWLQLKSGDNQDMKRVIEHVDEYLAGNPPPAGISVEWAGLTYLNVVWQDVMVRGMLEALIGSFIIVFVMMLVLFRSFWFGLLAMLPLTITIVLIYGLIGLVGRDYDMPVAVLSSLTLGLSVDFAIHFLQRARAIHAEVGSWPVTVERMFHEPARAIVRNAIVIAIGFLPLLASPLVPYNTVGLFLAAIMALSSAVTLVLLPSVMEVGRSRLFKEVSALPGVERPGEAQNTIRTRDEKE